MDRARLNWYGAGITAFPGEMLIHPDVELVKAAALSASKSGGVLKVGMSTEPFSGTVRRLSGRQHHSDRDIAVLVHVDGITFMVADLKMDGLQGGDTVNLAILGITGLAMRGGVWGAHLFQSAPNSDLAYFVRRSYGDNFHDLDTEYGMEQVVFMESGDVKKPDMLVARSEDTDGAILHVLGFDHIADGELDHWRPVEVPELSAFIQLQRFTNDSTLFAWTEQDGLVLLDLFNIMQGEVKIMARNPEPPQGMFLRGMSRETDDDGSPDGPDLRFALVETTKDCQVPGFRAPGTYQVPLSMLSELFGKPGEYIVGDEPEPAGQEVLPEAVAEEATRGVSSLGCGEAAGAPQDTRAVSSFMGMDGEDEGELPSDEGQWA